MASCEKCWGDAFVRSLEVSKDQAECYKELLKERKDTPCTPEEQAGQFWDEENKRDKRRFAHICRRRKTRRSK